MAPRVGCLLLPILFIASARVILVDAHKCGDPPEGDPCTADPAITCAGCGEGATVSDPFDCTSFYVCDGEGDYLYLDPLPCPDGYIFDEIERGCIIGGRCSFNCGKPGKGGIAFIAVKRIMAERYPIHLTAACTTNVLVQSLGRL
ncbi:uncharacterized protein LOC123504969 [Portunus trituberculatus]|uniref:uncharacterized protein LOC123504969 n=1 Tax=Portunus trituberculatus TaxID=210409 RepID=UPI001E1CDCFA|nr:uncharacterized protein LOC123504969 [Portunus trituberculatus]